MTRAVVLGPFALLAAKGPVRVPGGKVRLLLETLLVAAGREVTRDTIIAALWPEVDPTDPRVLRRLHTTMGRLRALLASGSDPTRTELTVVATERGVRLVADAACLDRIAFDDAVAAALQPELALGEAVARIEQSLSLWRGEPFTGFAVSPQVIAERERLGLQRQRLIARLTQLGGGVAAGSPDAAETPPAPRIARPAPGDGSGELPSLRPVGEVAVIAVSAPAGSGKTALLERWTAEQHRPTAWVALTPGDRDPARFWAAVGAAVDQLVGATQSPSDAAADAGRGEPPEVLADRLARDGSAVALVIDDLDRIDGPELTGQLVRFLERLPPRTTVVLAARRSLTSLTAGLECSRIVQHVAVDALGRATRPTASVDPGVMARLRRLGRTGLGEHRKDRIGSSLVLEVLPALPDEVRSFLLATAHLDRLHPQLCAAVTGREDAGALLGWLRRHGMFLVASRPGATWYRYHEPVRDELRRYLELEGGLDLAALHRRAADWFLNQGAPEDALRYAARAGDRRMVADLSGDVLLTAGLRGDARTCRALLDELDPDAVADDARSHAIATCVAAVWLDVPARARWRRSRAKHYGGQEDLILTYVEAVEAADQGRSTDAVAATQQVLDQAWPYVKQLDPDLVPLMAASALSNLVLARLLSGSLHHDDPMLATTVAKLRPEVPPLADWVTEYWALAALVDGEDELARSLTEEYEGRSEPLVVDDLRAPSTIVGAVLAAAQGLPKHRVRGLADQLLPAMAGYDRLGADTRAAVARLAAAHLYELAGDHASAATHRRRAEIALLLLEDAPFIARFRDVLDERLVGIVSASQGPEHEPVDGLTSREREVLEQLATTRTMPQIAEVLHVSPHTVRSHARAIYRKLGASSRHEAVTRGRAIIAAGDAAAQPDEQAPDGPDG